jgi:hypothetical protein
MSTEDIASRFDKHETILIDHAAKLLALADADKRLAAVDEKLEEDIRSLRQMMHDGFAEGRERDAESVARDAAQSVVLSRIENEAFRSVPGKMASQIALHGLVWQVVGVVAMVALTLFVAYVKFHH